MSAVWLGARLGLALIFAIAAVGKLADRSRFRDTLAQFETPRPLLGAGAIVLPLVELAIAGLLIPPATARAGALAALVLLIAFCTAIARALARGERPDCGCLGRAHSAPIGPGILARNAALGFFAAAIAVAGPGGSIRDALAGIDASPLAVALALAFLGQTWLLWQLFRQHGRLIERLRAVEAAQGQPAAVSALPVVRRIPRGPVGRSSEMSSDREPRRALAG
jgi:Methylamine utilisation protein MauE